MEESDLGCLSDTAILAVNIVPVGVRESDSEFLKVFPNPSNNLITVQTIETGMFCMEITSMNGQIIHSRDFIESSHQIDLSTYEKGVYFITVRSKNFVRTEKIIKL